MKRLHRLVEKIEEGGSVPHLKKMSYSTNLGVKTSPFYTPFTQPPKTDKNKQDKCYIFRPPLHGIDDLTKLLNETG